MIAERIGEDIVLGRRRPAQCPRLQRSCLSMIGGPALAHRSIGYGHGGACVKAETRCKNVQGFIFPPMCWS
jgi:hypothetical protein